MPEDIKRILNRQITQDRWNSAGESARSPIRVDEGS